MKFTFQDASDDDHDIRLRLFDETQDLIYLDNMHDYVITVSPRSISIACQSGNQICYGGQVVSATPTPFTGPNPTPNSVNTWGTGLNNDQECSDCCFTCVGGTTIPRISLRCISP